MTWEHVLLTFLLLWNLYLSAVVVARAHRLSTQMAVLTLRIAEYGETLEAVEMRLKAIQVARPGR